MKDLLGLDHNHLLGLAYGGMRPHSAHEHTRSPNAIIIRNDKGVEVLSFGSGQPITRLDLPDVNTVYADLNGDQTIEQIRTDFSG